MALDEWISCCGINPGHDDTLIDICRLEVFERLGMAHTCCTTKWLFQYYGSCWRGKMKFSEDLCDKLSSGMAPTDSEIEQLQEED